MRAKQRCLHPAKQYSLVFKKTGINSECVTHESYIKLYHIVGRQCRLAILLQPKQSLIHILGPRVCTTGGGVRQSLWTHDDA